ncbi:hypothetical protein D3C78_1762050 [compost metagenome]
MLLLRDLGHADRKIQLAHRRAAGQIVDCVRRVAERRAGRQQQIRRPVLIAPNALHRVHVSSIFRKPNRAAPREPPQAPRNAMRISRASAARNSGRT